MPAGRPKIEINREAFESLCAILCTQEEIAGFFKCSPDTIERWCEREYKVKFAEIYKKYSVRGKISLRRTQFKLAEKSAAMAIFLGKQYLGQSDVVTMKDGGKVEDDALTKSLKELAKELDNREQEENAD